MSEESGEGLPGRVSNNPNPFCSCAQTAKAKPWPSRRSGTPRGTLSAWTVGLPVSARGQWRGPGGSVVRWRWRFRGGCPFLLCGEPISHSVPRPHVGQFKPGRTHLHRVLRHSPEPGHTPVPRPLAGFGRLASGADPGADGNWQRYGQPRVGEQHARPSQTLAGLLAVCARERTGGLPRGSTGRVRSGAPQGAPHGTCSCREERESWIRAKYEQLLFLAPLGSPEEPLGRQLWAAVQAQDVAAVLLLLAHARHGPLDTSVEDPQLRSPLHLAAELAHVVITQLLLWVRERGERGGLGGLRPSRTQPGRGSLVSAPGPCTWACKSWGAACRRPPGAAR